MRSDPLSAPCHYTVRPMPKYDTFHRAGEHRGHCCPTQLERGGRLKSRRSKFLPIISKMKHRREFQQPLVVMNDERFERGSATVETKCAAVPTPQQFFFLFYYSFSFNNTVGTSRNSTEPTQTAALRGDAVNFQKHNEQFSRGWKNCTVHSEQRVKQTRGAQV